MQIHHLLINKYKIMFSPKTEPKNWIFLATKNLIQVGDQSNNKTIGGEIKNLLPFFTQFFPANSSDDNMLTFPIMLHFSMWGDWLFAPSISCREGFLKLWLWEEEETKQHRSQLSMKYQHQQDGFHTRYWRQQRIGLVGQPIGGTSSSTCVSLSLYRASQRKIVSA